VWERTHCKKKKKKDLVIASKENGLEGNAEKTTYMAMSGDQNAGQNSNIKIGNEHVKLWNSLNIWKKP
jgi:hypothetical protein